LLKALCLLGVFTVAASAQDAAGTFQSRIQPLLKTYCTECHAGAKPKAGFNLSGARTAEQLCAERDVWFRVLDQVEAGTMPPKDEKQPTAAERAALVAWLRGDFTNALLAKQRAEGRIAGSTAATDIDLERARIALMKSLIRLQVAAKVRMRS